MNDDLRLLTLIEAVNPDKVKKVNIDLLPKEFLKMAHELMKPRMCFNNAYDFITELFIGFEYHPNDLSYVLGFSYKYGMFLEHAWVKIGDQYFDPTWQLFSNSEGDFYIIKEFKYDDVCDFVLDNNSRLPDILEMLNSDQDFSDIISNEYRIKGLEQVYEMAP